MNNEMNDEELYEKLKRKTDGVQVPDYISPDNIRMLLETTALAEDEARLFSDTSGKKASEETVENSDAALAAAAYDPKVQAEGRARKKSRRIMAVTLSAAAAVAVILVAIPVTQSVRKYAPEAAYMKDTEEVAEVDADDDAALPEETMTVRKDAGTMFTVAHTDEVYSRYIGRQLEDMRRSNDFRADGGIVLETEAVEDSAENGAAMEAATNDAGGRGAGESYSGTNLREAGVDESDIAKTDGKYIYRADGDTVHVTRAENGSLTACPDITLKNPDGEITNIHEIYVSDRKLIALATLYKYSLEEDAGYEETADYIHPYYWDDDVCTVAYTYDITDPENPVLKGAYTQDGSYSTSRLINGLLLLFSNDRPRYYRTFIDDVMPIDDIAVPEASSAGNDAESPAEPDYPTAGDRTLTAEDVWLPGSGTGRFIMSSVDIAAPEKTVDACMIVNNYCETYVTTDSIYLYSMDWDESGERTDIARFSFKDGHFDAEGANSVAGTITDSFAIHESKGHLFALTTQYNWGQGNGESENALYVLDSKMSRKASLTGIAPGEVIYAARYVNDIIYFITYRNMDPLFAVDVSAPEDPVLLGNVEISGFSDYLHPWGEGRLLGFGQETDPENGRFLGLKLVMFDIEDPLHPQVLGSAFLGQGWSDMWNYKALLAESDRNLFGFAAQMEDSVSDGAQENYHYSDWYNVYSWDEANKEFVQQTGIKLKDNDSYNARGIRIGSIIYASADSGITTSEGESLKY